MEVPKDLVEEIARGNCVVFVGAGLSMGAGLPSWDGLLRRMMDWAEDNGMVIDDRDELEDEINAGNLIDVAEEMLNRFERDDFRRFMADVFRQKNLEPQATHLLLPDIPFSAVLTSNYDTLIEAAYTIVRRSIPHVFTHQDYPELSGALRSREFYVLKVHGTIDRIETVVLGHKDYREVIFSNSAYRQFLNTLFSTKTVLFVGFGMSDPDLLFLLDELRSTFQDYTGRHYALMSIENIKPFRQRRFNRDYGLKIIPYDNHFEIPAFLKTLSSEAQKIQKNAAPVEQTPFTPLHDLAQEVQTWLQAIRYDVSPPVKLGERTMEMVATLDQGTVKQSVRIHCIGGEVNAQDVEELAAQLNIAIPQGWLISDRRVSPSANAQAVSNDALKVFTLSGFLKEKVWGPYFEALTTLVVDNRLPELYVDLSCYKQEMDDEGQKLRRESYDSLDAYIDDWLSERGKMHISVLGEFGTGKTWFCQHYAHRQLARYLENPAKERLPILITLRAFTKSLTAHQLINDALIEQYQLPFFGSAFEVFERLNGQGKLLLILDGFDEMARLVDYQTVVDNFWELAKLVKDRSKVILTSRTEYFRWAKESETVLGGEEFGRHIIQLEPPKFEVLYLEPFSDDQIREVITRRFGEQEGPGVADRLLKLPNIAEMARKPVLVELLLAALEEVSANILNNPAHVYLYATNQLLIRNIATQRTFTSTADKLYFLCELAWEMLESGELRIHYKAIPERIKQYFGCRSHTEVANWR